MLGKDTLLQSRYRVVGQLGSGGMGAVYEAVDDRFGDSVALKEIIVDLASLEDEKHRESVLGAFEREAKSLAKAKHEAIPYVRDYFSESDRQYLVMELVEGADLSQKLMRRKSPFSLRQSLDWMKQLLDALDYLHKLSPPIIHRDIKPQNLKVNSRGRIKLLDFGIAKSSDHSGTVTSNTFVGATQNYSPIEQMLRVIDPTFRDFIISKHADEAEKIMAQETDARSDIYSLGACFYHLLTRSLPADVVKRAAAVWEGKPDPLVNPSELNPKIPAEISNCLLTAMEISREKRFGSAEALRQTLNEIEPLIAGALEADAELDEYEAVIEPLPETRLPGSLEPTRQSGGGFVVQLAETALSEDFTTKEKANGQAQQPLLPIELSLPKTKRSNAKWFALLGASLLLGGSAIGGIAYINSSNQPAVKAPSNSAASTMATLTPLPVSTPVDTNAYIGNTAQAAANTKTAKPAKAGREESVFMPPLPDEPPKTPKQKPVKTPRSAAAAAPPEKTPAPTPKPKPKQDPNCVFTNTCN